MRRPATKLLPTFVVLSSIVLASCGDNPFANANPDDITVSTALTDIGEGFAALQNKLDGQTIGLFPCAVNVTLNVKASTTSMNKLVVDVSKVDYEGSGQSTGERGNTVKVEMYNPACLPEKTLGYKNPSGVGVAKIGMAIPGDDAKNEDARKRILNLFLHFPKLEGNSADTRSPPDAHPAPPTVPPASSPR